jgi:hypothetical protein
MRIVAVKHNQIDYGIAKHSTEPKWRFTIYPKIEVGPKVISPEWYGSGSYEAAEAACKAEIDHGLSEAPGRA